MHRKRHAMTAQTQGRQAATAKRPQGPGRRRKPVGLHEKPKKN